ncbi:membrane-bound lytic murein transglycosylase B [Breoghania corrubedonensis]|uniref:Membrane-bound lytic murein transglycosylase B n=2 Tax=Breoghania corrubedonensis TaxID=665038 RepID=A0A2T5V6U1_9HYPH|nr:membrane-bound lytic murein transglycosylase B [Breoghania corrubedonensis]
MSFNTISLVRSLAIRLAGMFAGWRSGGIAAAGLIALMLLTPATAQASFDGWKRSFWREAHAAGISRTTYDRAMRGVTLDREVIAKTDNQAEFVRPVWDYLERVVSDNRIENGREKLREYAPVLYQIEKSFGVDRHVVVAIWGMESAYGAVLDNHKIMKPVVRSLASLAYDGGRYKRFGRKQLIAALKILQKGDVDARHMMGSWAGAMGHTQFIPTTYNAYAVDFDGDGKRDIWGSIPDALASTAAYLNSSGWVPGKTWGYEVKLPKGFNYALGDTRKKRTLEQWAKLGVKRTEGRSFPRPSDEAFLLAPAGAKGPAFLMLKNFNVIKRYNNADSYALAVGHLADRLRGGDEFVREWPDGDRPLSDAETKRMQALLNRRGHEAGTVDGKIGDRTRAAIRAYQRNTGMAPDGFASLSLLEMLQGS